MLWWAASLIIVCSSFISIKYLLNFIDTRRELRMEIHRYVRWSSLGRVAPKELRWRLIINYYRLIFGLIGVACVAWFLWLCIPNIDYRWMSMHNYMAAWVQAIGTIIALFISISLSIGVPIMMSHMEAVAARKAIYGAVDNLSYVVGVILSSNNKDARTLIISARTNLMDLPIFQSKMPYVASRIATIGGVLDRMLEDLDSRNRNANAELRLLESILKAKADIREMMRIPRRSFHDETDAEFFVQWVRHSQNVE